ncbi:MAG: hypothetical protein VB877_05185 [Pirellulaceae bacterium]
MFHVRLACCFFVATLLFCSDHNLTGCEPTDNAQFKNIQKRNLLKQIQILEQAIQQPQKQLAHLFAGSKNLDTVRHPDKVTGYLLPLDNATDSLKVLHDRKHPFTLKAEDQEKLSRLLSKHENYEWGARYLCEIRYGIRLEFEKGDHTVSVYLCLGCGHAGIMPAGKKYEHDMRAEHLDKGSVYTAVAEIIKRSLPEIDAIQAISIEKKKNPYNATPYRKYLDQFRKELGSL